MSAPFFVIPEQLAEAKRLRAEGVSLLEIGRRLGCSDKTIKRKLEPSRYGRERSHRSIHDKARAEGDTGTMRATRADFLARLAEIPVDTRTPAQVLLGEPIPNDPRRVVLRRLERRAG